MIIEKGGPCYLFCCRKKAQLRSKPLQAQRKKVEERRKTAQLRSKTVSSIQHNCRSYFAVTSRLLRGHNGHYVVTTVTTQSLRGHYGRGHYGHYAVKEHIFETEKRSTSFQNGHCCRRPLISLMFQNGFIIPQICFKFDSIKAQKWFQ